MGTVGPVRRGVREGMLWAGAVLGVVALGFAGLAWIGGVSVLIFQSGSMAPAYETGSVGLARDVPAEQIAVGDVVSVEDDAGQRVTHRVVVVDSSDTGTVLTLQGDANAAPDTQPYVVDRADRVFAGIPWVGYVLGWLAGPVGLLAIGAFVASMLWLGFGPPADRGGRRRGAATVAAGLLVIAVPGAPGVDRTQAAWSDAATAVSGSLTSHAVVSHAQPVCTDLGGVLGALGYVQLAWAHVDIRYAYDWRVVRVSNNQVLASGTITPTGASAGSSVELEIRTSLLNLGLGGVNLNVVVTSRLRAPALWFAPTSTTTPIRTSALLVGLSVRCGHV